MIDIIYEYTKDNLKLQGTYFDSEKKDVCVLFVHGQAQSILDNEFACVWGKYLSSNGRSFLYGHNRGYDFINCMVNKEGNFVYNGATFEIFEDSLKDIDLWVNKIKELGYKKVILLGHSLGCNKVLYYISKYQENIDGVIFASAPDMVGITKKEEKYFNELYNEAINSEDNKLLSKLLCGTDYISAATFINENTEDNPIDNFPIERNPKVFNQLSTVTIPVLSLCGSNEYPTYLKQELLKEKAINCTDYTFKIIENTNHLYQNKEEEVSLLILNWTKERYLINVRELTPNKNEVI